MIYIVVNQIVKIIIDQKRRFPISGRECMIFMKYISKIFKYILKKYNFIYKSNNEKEGILWDIEELVENVSIKKVIKNFVL